MKVGSTIGRSQVSAGQRNIRRRKCSRRTLHMDEQTPHLHVTVVPIVTTRERKRRAKRKPGSVTVPSRATLPD
ncbi:plasmid recombination protein [Duncaniella muris]|uniref:plasmid recombination protein n=1 Tax=Duncaniella muris TaxID=2094150 RepID=UPI003F673813